MQHQRTVRRLRDLLEPIAASVYFAPECHAAYQDLGFGPSEGDFGGVAAPNRVAYFWSRGAAIGDVDGEVIASAFGVFNPSIVCPQVDQARAIASRAAILDARMSGQRAFLDRVLGPDARANVAAALAILRDLADATTLPGHPLCAGLRALGSPGDELGDLWRAADIVREHRGDAHVVAWTGAGLSGPQIMLLTEHWWAIPRRSYAATRGWTADQFDEAQDQLEAGGLVRGDDLTTEGMSLRRAIEDATDWQERGVADALGSRGNELFALLAPIVSDIVTHAGYPPAAFMTESDLDRR